MESKLYRTAVFAVYQCILLVGIVMLPFALAARHLGVSLPFHRLVDRVGDAYERAGDKAV